VKVTLCQRTPRLPVFPPFSISLICGFAFGLAVQELVFMTCLHARQLALKVLKGAVF